MEDNTKHNEKVHPEILQAEKAIKERYGELTHEQLLVLLVYKLNKLEEHSQRINSIL